MRFPDFYVVGAAKSGTTSIWTYFQKHPEIYVTKNIAHKELGYFSPHYGISDKETYLSFFRDASPNQMIGEVCHAYISSPSSAEAIKKEVPHAKIIMVLRNPIERSYSLYNWMVMHGYEYAHSFERALELEKKRSKDQHFINHNPHGFYQNYMYFSSGLYYEQVKRYLDLYGKENVQVIIYDHFKKHPLEVMRQIEAFLGVSSIEYTQKERENVSVSVRLPLLQYVAKMFLIERFHNKNRLHLFLKKLGEYIFIRNKVNTSPKPILPQTRNMLLNAYSEDVSKLSKLLNQDLSALWIS